MTRGQSLVQVVAIFLQLFVGTAVSYVCQSMSVGLHETFHSPRDLKPFLAHTPVVNWEDPSVSTLAQRLAAGSSSRSQTIQTCFEWVRDQVHHCVDHQTNPVTNLASDVLKHRTGFCYSKSHLLAALLRANGIPTGFCYQRLQVGFDHHFEPQFCLHGFNAVYMIQESEERGNSIEEMTTIKCGSKVHQGMGHWYRLDPRGNNANVNAQFAYPQEQLAYPATCKGEQTFSRVYAEPLEIVTKALAKYCDWEDLMQDLPDLTTAPGSELSTIRH